jgi:hypothetical protein
VLGVIWVFIIPGILARLFFALPFLDRGRERRPWKRPIPVGGVLIVLLGLTWLGMQSRLDDARDATNASQIAQQDLEEAHCFDAAFVPDAPSSAPQATRAAAGPGKAVFDAHGLQRVPRRRWSRRRSRAFACPYLRSLSTRTACRAGEAAERENDGGGKGSIAAQCRRAHPLLRRRLLRSKQCGRPSWFTEGLAGYCADSRRGLARCNVTVRPTVSLEIPLHIPRAEAS